MPVSFIWPISKSEVIFSEKLKSYEKRNIWLILKIDKTSIGKIPKLNLSNQAQN